MSEQVVIQKETIDLIYKIAQIDKPETFLLSVISYPPGQSNGFSEILINVFV